MDHRLSGSVREFLFLWRGYPLEAASWLAGSVIRAPDICLLIDDYFSPLVASSSVDQLASLTSSSSFSAGR